MVLSTVAVGGGISHVIRKTTPPIIAIRTSRASKRVMRGI
jgi:hypothetical protein